MYVLLFVKNETLFGTFYKFRLEFKFLRKSFFFHFYSKRFMAEIVPFETLNLSMH